MAGQKFEIDRRPEERVTLHPFLDLAELLDRHFAREKEIFRPQIQPLDHVLFGPIVGLFGSFGPLRTSAASFSLIKPAAINSPILSSTNLGWIDNCDAIHSRIFLRMNIALVQM